MTKPTIQMTEQEAKDWEEASLLFHTLRYEKESSRGIEMLLAYKRQFALEQVTEALKKVEVEDKQREHFIMKTIPPYEDYVCNEMNKLWRSRIAAVLEAKKQELS